jgi:signal transduction histidine kinase
VTRRIREAIVGVSAAILLVLGLPLAAAVHRVILDSEVVEREAAANRTLAEIAVPLDARQLASIRHDPDAPPPFAIYDTEGRRIYGTGPDHADSLVRHALEGDPATSQSGSIEVALPIPDRSREERILGAVRLEESRRDADRRTHTAWLVMGGSALLALAGAWLVGTRLARRLSQPIIDLATEASSIGDGGTMPRPAQTGIEEIDQLSTVLSDSTDRVNEALARERRFSADVSHQLRTPMTALRLHLETAASSEDSAEAASALADLARLEETVDHLLVVARDAQPTASTVRLDLAASETVERWRRRAEAAGRAIATRLAEVGPARGAAASVGQILDVLIDNALHHGEGAITLTVRRIAGGAAVDVSDEGESISRNDVDRIFERGHGSGHGIGLALARAMAEREGGRLVLSRTQPTTFSLILLQHDPSEDLELDRR